MASRLSASAALVVLLVAVVWLPVAMASRGDRDPAYRSCLYACARRSDRVGCKLDWPERLFFWDCMSECKYRCAQQVTDERVREHRPVLQYHGKWPFQRVLGMQELASTTASLANGLPYLLHRNLWRQSPASHPLRSYLRVYPWVGMSCWLWSAAYHARDVFWTERLDYHCATLLVFFMAFSGLQRVLQLRRAANAALAIAMVALYLSHVAYLNIVHFDYGWNFVVTATALVVSVVAWVAYTFRAPTSFTWKCRTTMLLTAAFGVLDVIDFPPVLHRLIDPHAMWHISTIPLGFLWWSYLRDDVQHAKRKE